MSAPAEGPLDRLARRLFRHGAVYSAGTVVGIALAVAQIVVLTRLMPPAEFGRLALLVIFAGFVTLLGNLGVVQGTLVSAFRGGDDEDDVDADRAAPPAGSNRRLLGTGLAVVLLIGAALIASAALAGPLLGAALLGDRGTTAAVVVATAYGTLGSVWRLVSAIPRFERRPRTYVLLTTLHRLVALGAAATLVATGSGFAGAMVGLLVGRAFALAVALWISRHRFKLALDRDMARTVARQGAPFVSISITFFVARNVDLYVLSLYESDVEVALYRVAGRLSAVAGMALNITLLAWGPLVRGPLAAALEKAGAIDLARARIVTYFAVLAGASIVALVLTAEVLVRVAASSYRGAATIVPLLGVAAAAAGALTLVYRMARVPGKIRWYRWIGVLYAVLTLLGSLALVPRFGASGAAAAAIGAAAVGTVVMVWVSQRGPHPLPLEWGRLVRCALVTGACAAAGVAARPLSGTAAFAAGVAIAAAFVALTLLTRAMPPAETRRLLGLAAPRSGRIRRQEMEARLDALDAPDRELVDALAVRRETPARIAAEHGRTEGEAVERFVAILRRIGDAGEPTAMDDRIGAYLLSRAATTRRDVEGYVLALRADALELDRLTEVFDELRGTSRSRRRRAGAQAAPSSS